MTVLKGPLAVKQSKALIRTLVHLKNSPTGVNIILFSDNVGNNKLHNIEFTDFCKEYPTVNLSLKKTGGIFHDRFIVLAAFRCGTRAAVAMGTMLRKAEYR